MPEKHDSFVTEIEVEKILVVISNSRAIALANNAVPGRSIQLIHVQFDI